MIAPGCWPLATRPPVTADVIELKLYDPLRHPATWTDILRRGQYVAFAKTVDTGAPCDDKGQPFASPQDAVLVAALAVAAVVPVVLMSRQALRAARVLRA